MCGQYISERKKKNFFQAHAVPSSKRVIYSYLSLDKRVIFDSFGELKGSFFASAKNDPFSSPKESKITLLPLQKGVQNQTYFFGI